MSRRGAEPAEDEVTLAPLRTWRLCVTQSARKKTRICEVVVGWDAQLP